ncbi:hypothetical protein VPH35_117911 [Triticum aestivum]|uniref:putative F-box/LRR-repeat protein 23 n=2 Tax=Triticinae TaxID=1648030 RepID=UPI0008436689|nr:putative F-box/LRR-repeat protein 23 [Triticum aestivum]
MPLLPPPPPPTAPPGRGRRRLGSRRRRRSKRRNWAELPLDVMLYVLHKLDDVELMFGGAARVCRSWHDAVCEPELWRRVDMRGRSRRFRETVSLNKVTQLSIRFSAGQCREFFGQQDLDNDLLLFLADRAPLLKSLHLTKHCDVTSKALAEAMKKFPLLEELELCECERYDTCVFELVATACPLLKHFKHVNDRAYSWYYWERDLYPVDNREALAIARMHELRSLKIFHSGLDNQGLTAILDGCPHLESLDIRYCSNIIMDSSMRAKCARVKTKKVYPYAPTDDWVRPRSGIHDDSIDDSSKYFEPGSPVSRCHSPRDSYWWFRSNGEEPDCRFFNVEPCDSEDSDHSRFFSGAEETEFEYWRI